MNLSLLSAIDGGSLSLDGMATAIPLEGGADDICFYSGKATENLPSLCVWSGGQLLQ